MRCKGVKTVYDCVNGIQLFIKFDSLTGVITSRLTTDTATMSTALQSNVINFLRHLVKLVTVVFFMVRLSWRLSVVIFACLPITVIVSTIYGKFYMHISYQVQTSLADANNVAAEVFSTMRTVRSFANEDGEIERYAKQLGTSYKMYKKQAFAYASYNAFNILIDLVMRVATLVYGRYNMEEDELTGGIFLAFVLYQLQLGKSLNRLTEGYRCLHSNSYIERKPKMKQNESLQREHLAGTIEFDNVSFSYPSRPNEHVLNGISFKVESGEIVALVGPNGCGKTSCVNLLECFYKPSGGRVLLDGSPVHLYEHHFLHKQVSLVEQEPILYARSIGENIRYGLTDNECSTDKIREISKLTNCDSFISRLHDGYETLTGEKGLQLSGGQKQRVAIARSLVRNPKVLILDEATSALDAESEQAIQELIYNKNVFRTVVIIAHKLGTVEKADRILVIDKCRVVEEGTHKDLMIRADGVNAGLVNCQFNKKTDENEIDITIF
ncbi:ABC-type oligopeptide transporter ABCB9-like [Mercenaria mercenaria]|uniref:ABC-type oligopeptide transporter ABCB9-like n=1 Tax=Mercenaria mercenaria TaxID=6596 RepID=UPI00234E525E|nr:ABC-type oligopeptide transporter ABCB9-like [Mercenaria mercenaria]